jgi:glycosyltransferase involved in cell wall biosynthesis
MLARRLNHLLKGADTRSVFCFTQLHPGLLAQFPREKVIYVANDDHASMAQDEQTADQILQDEARAVVSSGRVLSVSEVIARRLTQFGRPVHVMYPGHGCDALPVARFADGKRLPRSVCFFGYIDWRIDFELLAHLLEAGWSVALIGQEVSTAKQIRHLKSMFPDNFDVQPPVASEIAPEILARYEVLIMPYRYRNAAQAEVMELPNKTFVYLCAMRPVVTTWMPNLKLVEPGLIYRARTNQEFIDACERAVRDDSEEYAVRRSNIARQNSWNARRGLLKDIIDGKAEVFEEYKR